MVLAAQFESFIQPIVIMTVLPLSVPFALFTLWATGRTLNLWSALGVLLLLGIVKKNSILQVDYANVLRAQGRGVREAIVEASRTRLRPILMTTCAILAGLVPTALGIGIGGQQRAAIAVTIIGGQSLCLFLTLLLVPVAYVKFDALEQSSFGQRFSAATHRLKDARVGAPALPFDVASISPITPMNVMEWLLDSDPAIRWQVMRDLVHAPARGRRGGARARRHGGLGRQAAGVAG